MSRLATIATRQKSTRVRDALFTLCVAATALVSIVTLG